MSKKRVRQTQGDSNMQNSQEDILTAMGEDTPVEDVVAEEVKEETVPEAEPVVDEPIEETPPTEDIPPVEEPAPEPVKEPEPLQPKPQLTKVGNDIEVLKGYLADYITRYTEHQVKSIDDKQDVATSITLFGNIINFLLRYPELELLEQVVEFFRKERGRVLNPKTALKGIAGLNPQSQHRYSMFYSLMIDATSPGGLKRKNVNMKVLEEMFNHPGFIKLLTIYMAKN